MPQNTTGRGGTFFGTMPRRTRQTSFPSTGNEFAGRAARQHYRIRTLQRMQRLPQSPRGKQLVFCILRRHENNVEVARQCPVLKAVVEQVQLRTKLRFGEAASLVAIFADDHRNLQLARNQQRFVAELLR